MKEWPSMEWGPDEKDKVNPTPQKWLRLEDVRQALGLPKECGWPECGCSEGTNCFQGERSKGNVDVPHVDVSSTVGRRSAALSDPGPGGRKFAGPIPRAIAAVFAGVVAMYCALDLGAPLWVGYVIGLGWCAISYSVLLSFKA
jgi:hypothetical protein